MNPEIVTVVIAAAVGAIGYAVFGLVRSLWETGFFPFARPRGPRTVYYRPPEADETVEILVTNDAGESVVIPLRPDSEESIRDFLRKADATTGG